MVILNSDGPTYHRLYDNSTSIIDLALTNPRQTLKYTWQRLNSLHGSDHYPVLITREGRKKVPRPIKWKVQEANWCVFTQYLETTTNIDNYRTPQQAYDSIVELINNAADKTIPKSSPYPKRNHIVPWWNKDCENARKVERTTFKRYSKKPSHTNSLIHKRAIAKKKQDF